MDIINTELLIYLVEQRPVLWDKTLDTYKHKLLKESAWREICSILNEDLEDSQPQERQYFAKLVLKKWTQIRDSWIKSIKKQKEQQKPGYTAKPSRPYIYHQQMSFLNKIVDLTTTNETNEPAETNDENTQENAGKWSIESVEDEIANVEPVLVTSKPYSPSSTSSTQRKRESETKSELDAKIIKFIDNQMHFMENKEDNRHLSFFRSILPSLASLNDDQILEFQGGVISLVQNIKRSSAHCTTVSHSTPSYCDNDVMITKEEPR